MRRLIVALCAVILVASGGRGFASICSVDPVPGATLLLPYFEVGIADPNSPNTIMTIANASATAVLGHVTIWSDLSIHVLDFDVYLTGYDVQNLNLGALLVNGVMPKTASAGQDPGDTISPKGIKSQDINFASCTGRLPLPNLPASFLDHVQKSLTGQPTPFYNGLCAGRTIGDGIMRGYVTVDTVNSCSNDFGGDSGYFGTATVPPTSRRVTDQNVLWGSVVELNKSTGKAAGGNLLTLEASPTDPQTSVPGQYTFYGRYNQFTAVDNREPLATEFGVRYVQGSGPGAVYGPAFATQGTAVTVWRDSKVGTNTIQNGAFTCPAVVGRPVWYPLGQEGLVIFDDQEHPAVPQVFPFSPQPQNGMLNPFPAEAQTVLVGGSQLPVPFGQGWLYLDLNTTVVPVQNLPPEDPAAAQAFAYPVYFNASPSWATVGGVTFLDSACTASHFVP